jgi:Holliday junction resolvasome RuvABC endonuclease subunit
MPAITARDILPKAYPRSILALDLGSRCGWAVLSARSGEVASGVAEFRPGRFEGAGMAFLRFETFLENINNAATLGIVVFEEVRAHRGTLAAQVYGGFLAHLTAWCERKAVPYTAVPVATIKRHATGKGNASKDEVIAAVRARGFAPKDDNEADAIAILDWAVANNIGGQS